MNMKCSATEQSNIIYLNNCGSSRKKRVANLDEKHVTAFDQEADRAKIIGVAAPWRIRATSCLSSGQALVVESCKAISLVHLRKLAPKCYCGIYLCISQILKPRCAAGADYNTLLSRYFNSASYL